MAKKATEKEVIEDIAMSAKAELSSVGKMLDKADLPPTVDALVEGPVISIQKSSVYKIGRASCRERV